MLSIVTVYAALVTLIFFWIILWELALIIIITNMLILGFFIIDFVMFREGMNLLLFKLLSFSFYKKMIEKLNNQSHCKKGVN